MENGTTQIVPQPDYTYVIRLFIELRNRGISIASADLDIIKAWEDEQIDPEFIVQVMLEYAEECRKKSKCFPVSLLSIARKVRTILIKS